jgi:hypothetical protein
MLEQFDTIPDSDFDVEKIDSILSKVQPTHSLRHEILTRLSVMVTRAQFRTILASTMDVLGKEQIARPMSRYFAHPAKKRKTYTYSERQLMAQVSGRRDLKNHKKSIT